MHLRLGKYGIAIAVSIAGMARWFEVLDHAVVLCGRDWPYHDLPAGACQWDFYATLIKMGSVKVMSIISNGNVLALQIWEHYRVDAADQ